LTEVTNAHRTVQEVINKLFPSVPLEALVGLSRDELVGLVLKTSQSSQSVVDKKLHTLSVDLDCLEPSPEQDFTWEEASDEEVPSQRVADDVNCLSLPLDDSASSYLGLSSVRTILRVITIVSPRIRDANAISKGKQQQPEIVDKVKDGHPIRLPLLQAQPVTKAHELHLIDAYFTFVHGITPMIDEADFRKRFAQDDQPVRDRGPWLSLLNMVLAMGYIASTSADHDGHNFYYRRAADYLNLRCLGSGHLYTIQALALLGGYYLHYRNRPNMANAILGATMRMATAIGLHRVESLAHRPDHDASDSKYIVDTRVRTWWSLFCLDTWASTTLGRPSLGRGTPVSISTIRPQEYLNVSLYANEVFCGVATRIQDRLVQTSTIAISEIEELDAELVRWYSSLPSIFLENIDQCPPSLRAARGLLRCRYLTLQMTLYRPLVLIRALQRHSQAESHHSHDLFVTRCRSLAIETIETISRDWFPNQISAWNSVWYLFQACLVLVLSVLSEPDHTARPVWDEQIRRSLDLLTEMAPWSPGAVRSSEVIRFLHDTQSQSQESSLVETNLDFFDFENSFGDLWNMDEFYGDVAWDLSSDPPLDPLFIGELYSASGQYGDLQGSFEHRP
ncbi:fungal-specific transcription factor domain-containing protein, partial [Talaromyces proteolyticus]